MTRINPLQFYQSALRDAAACEAVARKELLDAMQDMIDAKAISIPRLHDLTDRYQRRAEQLRQAEAALAIETAKTMHQDRA